MVRSILALSLCFGVASMQAQEGDSKQKVKALKDYARQGSEVLEKASAYLRDADPVVRREAVRTVTSIGTLRSLDPLLAALDDADAEVIVRATDGLVNFYLPGYVDDSFSATIKRAGDSIAGHFTETNDKAVDRGTPVRPEIVAGLAKVVSRSGSPAVRANAARALGVLRGKDAQPALFDSLKSKDTRLMYESLIALQKIGDRAAGPRVMFLMRDFDEKVKLTAIETVGLLRTTEATPELRRLLDPDPGKKVRKEIYFALARIPDPANRPLFRSLLKDKEEDSRVAAAEGLGRIGNAEERSAVESAFSEEKKTGARLAQAFAIAGMGVADLSEFAPLRFLVNNLNVKAWKGVAQPYLNELALARPDVRKSLLAAMGGGTKDERTGLAKAMAGCRAPEAVAPLEQLARDPDAAISLEALRALRILKASLP